MDPKMYNPEIGHGSVLWLSEPKLQEKGMTVVGCFEGSERDQGNMDIVALQGVKAPRDPLKHGKPLPLKSPGLA